MTSEIILTVPARHLTTGDHFNGMTVMSIDRSHAGGQITFKLVIPFTTHTMEITVLEKDLDAVSFPLTKRGDDYNPNPRNRALGLPPVPPKPYVAPEPIAVYPVGTRVEDIKHFDRSMHVLFACPKHRDSAWFSKDPWSSTIFPQSLRTMDCGPEGCRIGLENFTLTHEYEPTRNG